jgi:hypothetical protein
MIECESDSVRRTGKQEGPIMLSVAPYAIYGLAIEENSKD